MRPCRFSQHDCAHEVVTFPTLHSITAPFGAFVSRRAGIRKLQLVAIVLPVRGLLRRGADGQQRGGLLLLGRVRPLNVESRNSGISVRSDEPLRPFVGRHLVR